MRGRLRSPVTPPRRRIVCFTTLTASPVVREQLIEVSGDCPFAATRADEADKPVDESGEPVPEPGQEGDVHDEPDEPCDPAGEPHPVRAHDCASSVHRCHAAEIPISPWSRLGPV